MKSYILKTGNHAAHAGMERIILKFLPVLAITAIAIPFFMILVGDLVTRGDLLANAAQSLVDFRIVFTAYTYAVVMSTLTAALACVTVIFMKGPAIVADAYELVD